MKNELMQLLLCPGSKHKTKLFTKFAEVGVLESISSHYLIAFLMDGTYTTVLVGYLQTEGETAIQSFKKEIR